MRFHELLAYLSEKSEVQSRVNLDIRLKIIEKGEDWAIVQKESYKNGRLVYRAYYFLFNKAPVKTKEKDFYYGSWNFICPTLDQVKAFVLRFAPLVLNMKKEVKM